MDFDEAIAYLDAHVNLETGGGGATPVAGAVHGLSLDRMRGIVEVLGDPQAAAPVIHVTGTNGKGSVTRMITALLGAHGLTVGAYGSPHLEAITERIRRNSEDIARDDLADVIAEVASLESLFPDRPSYFDLLTATAFTWFAREAVEVMVVEVGMLGRFDSTNVVTADVAVVTNVGRDHTDGQGDWALEIAREKAGIIDPGSAVVIGETDPRLVEVFRAEGGATHVVRDVDFGVGASVVALGGRSLDLWTPTSRFDDVFLPAHGAHQADNAAVAVAAVEAFFARPLDRDVVAEALASVELPGKVEVLGRSPLVVLDAAHNPDGAAALARTLDDEFHVSGTWTLVVGLLGGRDLGDVLAPLLVRGPARVVCVQADSPRAVPAAEVADVVRALAPAAQVRVVPEVAAAVARALDELGEDDALVVAGSTYVAGEARPVLRRLLA